MTMGMSWGEKSIEKLAYLMQTKHEYEQCQINYQ